MEFDVNDKCVGCGACVKECPMGVLALEAGRPNVRAERAAGCMACGHCLAVCAAGAVTLNGVSPAQCKTLAGLPLPTGEMLANLLGARRSVRQYATEGIPRARLDELMEALKAVPTGCNIRHLTFKVVATRAKLDALRQAMVEKLFAEEATLPEFLKGVVGAIRRNPSLDPFFRGAPHLLIVEGDPQAVTPQVDCAAACAYFDLLTQASGYGSCWCGFLHIIVEAVPEVADIFGIPRGAPFSAMLFGVPTVRFTRTVPRPAGANVEFIG